MSGMSGQHELLRHVSEGGSQSSVVVDVLILGVRLLNQENVEVAGAAYRELAIQEEVAGAAYGLEQERGWRSPPCQTHS